MKIIPAIDIINGKCVRLSQGDYDKQIIYSDNPVEMAKYFADKGIEHLHLVDLEGAKGQKIINYKTIERIANQTNLEIDFGGGIKSKEDLKIAFESGASKVNIGSTAVSNKHEMLNWLQEFGPDKIILSADCRNRKIASQGWLNSSNTDVLDFLQGYEKEGITQTVVTDISRDGMLQGPSFELYQEILEKTELRLIASGGVTTVTDVIRLKKLGCAGVIIGKAIYEKKINLKDLTRI